MSSLVEKLLRAQSLKFHAITSRTKSRDSLEKKLNKPESQHGKLADVTDLSGVRIIAYFHDDVDRMARVLEREFLIDEGNSVDKRRRLDADRFGYLSLHYVVLFSSSRADLSEYRGFRGMKCEIQVRSILQHAWAEIEHDLGYKTEQEIPRDVRRRFSRVAGLLEVGDTEFVAIRDQLNEYKAVVQRTLADGSATIPIDGASLDTYFRTDSAAMALDARLAGILGAQVIEGITYNHILTVSFPRFGIDSIARLRSALDGHAGIMANYVRVAHGRGFYGDMRVVAHGYSGLVLCYVLAARNRSAAEVVDWLTLVGVGGADDRPATAQAMVQMYGEAAAEHHS